jgi:PAS domain S-box-containing protein
MQWLLIVLSVSSVLVLLVSAYCLHQGWVIIFQNLFYFPIIIACAFYLWRGFFYSVLLAFTYLALILVYSNESGIIMGALIRVLIFILVAGVVTWLSVLRVRAEESLKISEKQFRHVLDTLPIGIWMADKTGTLTYVNPEGEAIWESDSQIGLHGYDSYNAWRLPDHTPVNPDDWALGYAINEGRVVTNELLEIEAFDGTRKIIFNWAYPVHDDTGAIVGGFVINQDITERYREQEELRRSQQILKGILNTIPVRVFWKDINLNYLGCNTPFALDAGYKFPDEIIGKDDYSMGWREQADMYRRDDMEVISSGSAKLLIDEPQTTPSGDTIHILTSKLPLYDQKGSVIGVLGTFTDITERNQMIEALRQSEERFRLAMLGADDGLWDWNLKTDEVYYSPRWKAILGYAGDEIEPNMGAWKRLTHPDDMPRILNAAQDYLNGKISRFEVDFRMIHRDGHIVYILGRAFALRDADGTPLRLVGTHVDMTDRKLAEHALRQANLQLNLLSGITRHDILNNVNALQLLLTLIKDKIDITPVAELFSGFDEATSMIQSQIEFTRIYQDLGIKEPEWHRIITVLSKISVPDSVLLDVRVEDIEVYADALFGRVFYNLLDNSIRHGQNVRGIQVSTQMKGDTCIIIWEDDGIGISPRDHHRIFDRGFGKNTGLGLFFIREILSLTGITIDENGKEGKGARFEVVIPSGTYRCYNAGESL